MTASGYQKGNFEKRVTFDMVYVRWLRKVSDEWFNKLGDDKQEVMKHFKGATFTFMTGEEAYDVITTQALEKRAPLENVNKDGQGVCVRPKHEKRAVEAKKGSCVMTVLKFSVADSQTFVRGRKGQRQTSLELLRAQNFSGVRFSTWFSKQLARNDTGAPQTQSW